MMSVSFQNQKITELRQEKGLSQRALAQIVGVKQSNISRWESGVVTPNVLDMWVLADYFSVSIDYLVGRSEY